MSTSPKVPYLSHVQALVRPYAVKLYLCDSRWLFLYRFEVALAKTIESQFSDFYNSLNWIRRKKLKHLAPCPILRNLKVKNYTNLT